MDKQTMIISYEYDESKESMTGTFGLSDDEMAEFVHACVTGNYESATEALMAELPKREKADSLLLLLAAVQLRTIQHDVTQRILISMLKGEMGNE